MNLPTERSRTTELRDRWRHASLAQVWLRPGDWYHPAVDALIEAIGDRRPASAPAHRLGEARGQAGIGLAETLDDVMCLYDAIGALVDTQAVRGAALGWARAVERHPDLTELRDPASGLPTENYLVTRLRETYSCAERAGDNASQTHCLIVVDVAIDSTDTWHRVARAASVGRSLDQVFGDGHPMASLNDGIFVVLCERHDELSRSAQAIRGIVESNARVLGATVGVRRPVRVWAEPLPPTHEAAVALLDQLRR